MRSEVGPGTILAGYEVEEEVGRGGMGVVLRARQLALDRIVALKLIAPGIAADESFRARFRRESRLLASVTHPNVVTVYEAGEADGHLFVSMRWIDGTDLRHLLAEDGALPPDLAARIVGQVGDALDAAHAAGLVHRDVKPANILLEGTTAYLGDFGLSTLVGADAERLTRSGGWVGTVDYIAPEQIEDASVDRRADVYALGCVLYECLTGSVPFPRGSDPARLWAHLHDPPPSARESTPGVPAELDAVIRRALAKDPERRWQTAGDLGRAALSVVGNGGAATVAGPAPPPPAPEPDTVPGGPVVSWRPRRTHVIGAAVAALAIAGGATALALTSGGGHKHPATIAKKPPVKRADAPVVTPLPSRPVTIKRFSIGARAVPGDIAAAGGAAFVYDYRRGKLVVVDSTSGYVIRRLPAGRKPESIATDDADIYHRGWMVDFSGYLQEFNTDKGRLVGHRIRVQRDPAYAVDTGKEVVVLSRRQNGASLLRVNPKTRKPIGKAKEVGGAITDLAADGYDPQVLSAFPPEIRGYGPDLKKRAEFPIAVKTNKNVLVAVVGEMIIKSGVAWVIASTGDLVRVNLLTGTPVGVQLKVGREPRDIAVSDDSVWVPSEKDGTVTRIDLKTGRPIGRPIKVPDINGEIAVDPVNDDVWLSGARDIVRLTP